MVTSQIIRDWRGRAYRVGDSAQELLDRPRTWMLWLPWLAMLAISPLQYGYGAAIPHLMAVRGWTLAQALAPMAIWAICQAIVAFPTARALERRTTGTTAPHQGTTRADRPERLGHRRAHRDARM